MLCKVLTGVRALFDELFQQLHVFFECSSIAFQCSCQCINVQIIIPKCGSPKRRETVILPSMAMTARSVLRTATSVGLWPHSEAQRHKCADVNYAICIASTLKLINRSSELHLMLKPHGTRETQRHFQKPYGTLRSHSVLPRVPSHV